MEIDRYLNHLAIEQGKHLAIETMGNWYDPSWSKDLKKQGFKKVEVMCVYVNSADEIWRRVQARLERTGQLTSDYQTFLQVYVNSYYTNMAKLLEDPNVDSVTIYDNSGKTPVLLAQKNKKIKTKAHKKSLVYRSWFYGSIKK